MNLWGRFAGSIILLLIFIVACKEDESGLLGFKNSSGKFKVSFVEVPVPTTIMAIDSVRTYNDPNSNTSKRFMVGRYNDPKFGEISAETYTQFGPVDPTVSIPATAQFVSAFLSLSFDYYYYGDNAPSTGTFEVHQLLDSIPATDPTSLPPNVQRVANYRPYYFDTEFLYDPTPIGTTTYEINPNVFDETLNDIKTNPSSIDFKKLDTLSIKLSANFAAGLFELARGQTQDYIVPSRFRRIFKGLVIRPGSTNSKIIGINPTMDSTVFAKSKIILNYDEIDAATGDKIRKVLEYTLFNLTQTSVLFGFTRITADRSGTSLGILPPAGIEVEADGNRYYQSGNPVTTKVDFGKFLEFADTIPNLIFNSVQLSIEVDDADQFPPPNTLRLRYLNSANEFLNFYSNIDAESNLPLYPASMTYDEEGWFIIGQRLNALTVGPLFDINYNAETKQYTGDFTDYFQTLYDIKDPEFRYTDFAFTASSPLIGLSVNRTIFNKNNIKLKVFYTVPVSDK